MRLYSTTLFLLLLFFPVLATFPLLLGAFALVAVVMEECHISLWLSLWGLHSVSSNLSNCIFFVSLSFLPLVRFTPLFFLIKLTNNKRAAADRKSMRLGQPCGLRRRPDTDAFYAAGWRGRAGPRQAPARLNTHTYTHTHKKKPLSNRPPRSMAESATATTVHSCSSDKRLMLSNKEGCIHLERANVTRTEEVRKRKGGCECAREREAGWQVAASPAPEIVAVVRQREVS